MAYEYLDYKFLMTKFASLVIKTCNQDTQKTFIDRSFELDQLLEDDEKITW